MNDAKKQYDTLHPLPKGSGQPFFNANDINSFAVFHTFEDGKDRNIRGEPELLQVLNEKVAPLVEELKRYKNPNSTGTVALLIEENERLTEQVRVLQAQLKEDECPYCDEIVMQNERIAFLESEAAGLKVRCEQLEEALRELCEGAERQVGGFDALDELDMARAALGEKELSQSSGAAPEGEKPCSQCGAEIDSYGCTSMDCIAKRVMEENKELFEDLARREEEE